MRILFFTYRDFENPSAVGGDFYLWELARGLATLGHKVTLVCTNFPHSKQYETRQGVNIIRIPNSSSLPLKMFKTYVIKLKGQFDAVVEEIIGGQRLPFFGVLYAGTPLAAVWHQRNAKVFKEQYPLFMALPLSGIEYVLARLYRKATILTPSAGAKAQLSLIGLNKDHVKVVYDGVGERFLDVKMTTKREDIVVCLGKLRRYKRIDHAILAFKKTLDALGKPAKLVIAGKLSEIDQGYFIKLQELTKQLGIQEMVEFRINISEDEKVELLKRAKVLVQPSPVEGFSIVVAEANRCGTPVVVSDGVPFDVVHDGLNGYVFPYGDLDKCASEMAKLLSDDNAWREMSQNAYDWSKQFTWEQSSKKIEFILQNLVEKTASKSGNQGTKNDTERLFR